MATIELKHDVNDEVWFRLHEDGIEHRGYVGMIEIIKSEKGIDIIYHIDCRDGRYIISEDGLC